MKARTLAVVILAAVALLALPVVARAADVEMTFYGNQHFKFVTPGGKVILINPWVTGNPDWPKDMKLEDIKKVDAIFVSSGHGDDMGQADQIAKQSGATIVTPAELGGYFQQVGVPASQIFVSGAGGQGTVAESSTRSFTPTTGRDTRCPTIPSDSTEGSTPATS